MSEYPFDVQTCRATFILKGLDRNLIDMRNGTLKYLGSYNIKQYRIKRISLLKDIVSQTLATKQRKGNGKTLSFTFQPNADPMINPPSSISIEIVFGRRLLSVILTSFVPTFILVLV